MKAAHATEETTVTVIGRTSAISTGFVSAVEAEGWRWEEIPDLLTLFALPLPARTVIALPIAAFTVTSYALIRHLTSSLTLARRRLQRGVPPGRHRDAPCKRARTTSCPSP